MRRFSLPALLLLPTILAALALAGLATLTAPQPAARPLDHAWQMAEASGRYRFTTELVQTSAPPPMISNVGRGSTVDRLVIDGRVDRMADLLELRLAREDAAGLELKIEQGHAAGRVLGGSWQALDAPAALPPAPDALAYLAAARNVAPLDETGRFRFDLDGPAFAQALREQLGSTLAAGAVAPQGMTLDGTSAYAQINGSGTVTLDADGLPSRVEVTARFPDGTGGRVEAQITTTFADFDRTRLAVPWFSPERLLSLIPPPGAGRTVLLAQAIAILLALALTAGVITLTRSSLPVSAARASSGSQPAPHTSSAPLAALLIASLVMIPAAPARAAEAAAERREAAEQARRDVEAQQALNAELYGSTWNPSRDSFAAEGPQIAQTDMVLGTMPMPSALDLNSDEDGDGLTLIQELRLGTSPTNPDSDGDLISDGAEVAGFIFGSERWYSDPLNPDTNGDGRLDTLECPQLRLIQGSRSPAGVCPDTDGDGIPDLFDDDDDGDGVRDRVDLSPGSVLGSVQQPFNATRPFTYTLDRVQHSPAGAPPAGFPLLLDFQIRPTNPRNLTLADNVYDWPTGDSGGQIVRLRDTTFGSALSPAQRAADPRSLGGDTRISPMLELTLPSAATLPTAPPRAVVRLTGGLIATVTLTPSGAGTDLRLDAPPGSYTISVAAGTCSARRETTAAFAGVNAGESRQITGRGVLQIANGDHAIQVSGGGQSTCATIADLPNGGLADRMIDTAQLLPFGISVRDGLPAGTLLAYLPLTQVMDVTGMPVAFAARMFYRPPAGVGWGAAHEARVVWIVQQISDACRDTSPTPAIDCNRPANRVDKVEIIHVYDDSWILTGLDVREDRGMELAIVYEDPALEQPDARRYDDRLWQLADGLDRTFLAGRCTLDANRCIGRDLSVAEIERRWNGQGVEDATLRWNIPRGTLGVRRFSYPSQDFIGQVMMTDTVRLLNDVFTPFRTQGADIPTLLFVREETSRSVGLDETDAMRRIGGGLQIRLDPAGSPPQTIAGMSWAPFQYGLGGWESAPIEAYLDRLGARVQAASTLTCGADCRSGEAAVARAYYTTLFSGLTGMVQFGSTPLPSVTQPRTTDDQLARDAAQLISNVPGQLVSGVVASTTDRGLTAIARLASELDELNTLRRLFNDDLLTIGGRERFLTFVGQGLRGVKNDWADTLAINKLSLGGKIGAGLVIGGVLVGIGVSIWAATQAGTGVGVAVQVVNAVNIVVQTQAVVSAAQSVRAAVQSAGSLSKAIASGANAVSKAAKIGAVVGAIVSVAGTWAAFGAQMGIAGLGVGSIEANKLAVKAVAQTIVAAILLAIAFIPVVGQIIVAVVGLIDAIVIAICAAVPPTGGSSDRQAREWLCEGLSGVVASTLAWLFYGADAVTDLNDAGRVQTGGFDMQPVTPRLGLTVGSPIRYAITITSTIQLATIPADWKAQAYRAQFSVDTLRDTTLRYRLQGASSDFHSEIGLGNMRSEWQVRDQGAPANRRDRTRLQVIVRPELVTSFGAAGINQHTPLVLSEAQAVPYQECIILYCHIREEKLSTHTPFGRDILVDILPATLEEFTALTAKGGGFAQAWGQTGALTFPRLRDADGDGLLAAHLGGNDPNDATWDADSDGLSDVVELRIGSNPALADTDGDGLTDAEELLLGTNPTRADTDGDGLSDGEEINGWLFAYDFIDGAPVVTRVRSDPLDPDADRDGLLDSRERTFGFHPRVPSQGQVLSYETQVRESLAPRVALRFDEPDGATTFGGVASCEPPACPSVDDGRFGRARRFAAGQQLALAPPTSATDDVSIHAWVRLDSATDGIIAYVGNPAATGYGIGVNNGRFGVVAGGVGWLTTDRSPAPGVWQSVAATRSGGVWRMQIDGVALLGQVPGPAPRPLAAGDRALVGGVAGTLDDVLFFDRALLAEDMAALRAGQVSLDDLVLRPGEALRFRGTVRNELFGRYADGLFTTDFPAAVQADIAPRNFVLQPTQGIDIGGEVRVRPDAPSGPLTLTQVAGAIISDRREASGNTALWLRFDEPAGATRFADDSGLLPPRQFDCPTNRCPSVASGYIGSAARFDGVDDVLTGNYGAPEIADTFTVAAWVLPRSTHEIDGESATGTAGLLGQRYLLAPINDGPSQTRVGISVGTNGVSVYERSAGTFAPMLVWGGALSPDDWTHIAVVYDRKTPRLFVNGALVRTGLGSTRPTIRPEVRLLGGGIGTGGFYHGDADDLRVFGRALTEAEVMTIYARPAVRLGFDGESSGARSFRDSSGSNTPATCDGCPAIVASGAIRQAAQFSGAQSIRVGPSPNLDVSSGFTQALWINPDVNDRELRGIIGQAAGGPGSPPAMLVQDGRIILGFGSGGQWRTRTSFQQILRPGVWSHVVATYDGSGYQLYVNGAPVPLAAGDTVTGAPPRASETRVGRASTAFSVQLQRLTITEEGDGVGRAEVYFLWNGQRVRDERELEDGTVRTLNLSLSGEGSGRLQVFEDDQGEIGRGADDLMIDVTFSADQPSIPCGTTYSTTDTSAEATRGFVTLCVSNFSLPFRGRLDDVTIQRRALSADEVRTLYDSTVTSLHLRLDDPPASTLFRDATGRRAASCSGSGCPVTGLAGRDGQAVRFDGVNDRLDAGLGIDLARRSFSVGVWARRTGTGMILGQAEGNTRGLRLGFLPDGRFVCGLSRNDDLTAPAPPTDTWVHWACAYDAATRVRTIYRDGQQVAQGTVGQEYTRSGLLTIGAAPWGEPYSGLLDDLRIVNTALDTAGAQAMFRSVPSFVLHFDEPAGATSVVEGGGRTVSCLGGRCPVLGAKGQIGNAADFSGSPQVGTGTPLIVNEQIVPDGDFTVSFWTQVDTPRAHAIFIAQGGFRMGTVPGGELYVGPVAPTGVQLIGGSWVHLAATRAGGRTTLFVNGFAAWNDRGILQYTPSGSLLIGANEGGGENLNGRLDALAVYPRALTPAEVREIFRYQNGWVDERRDYRVTVDRDPPVTTLRSTAPFRPNRDVVLDIGAFDPTSQAASVELGVTRDGGTEVWLPAPACLDAAGGAAWCPTFDPQRFGGEGRYTLRTRGVDLAGNAETPGTGFAVSVDATPPTLAVALPSGGQLAPVRHPNDPNAWIVRLSGSASDPAVGDGPGSGVNGDTLRVTLLTPQGEIVGMGAQPARFDGATWTAEYVLGASEPSGIYQIIVSGEDAVGNRRTSTPVTAAIDATPTTLRFDATQITTTTLTLADTFRGSASDVPVLPGAALRLPLDEPGAPPSFADASESGNPALCSGACPAFEPSGRFGGARRFDGVTGLVVADSAALRAGAFSLAAWVRPTAGSTPSTLVAKGTSQYELQVGATGIRFLPAGAAESLVEANVALPDDWSHVAAVFDGEAARIYLNGGLVAERRQILPATGDTTGTPLTVGRRGDGTSAFSGGADEVSLYTRALPQDAVRALAAPRVAGVGRAEASLQPDLLASPFFNEVAPAGQVLHLPFDDVVVPGAAARFRDLSVSNTPGACASGECPTGAPGHIGAAIESDFGRRVVVSNPGAAPLGDFMIAQWFAVRSPGTWTLLGAPLDGFGIRAWRVEARYEGDSGDSATLFVGRSSVRIAAPAGGWQPGRWYHVAFARTLGSGGEPMAVRAFLDGTEVTPDSIIEVGPGTPLDRAAIEAAPDFRGRIDETRIFNRALRPDEVASLYRSSGPQIALGFDDRSYAENGATFADRSGWQRDATLRDANVALGRNATQSSTPGAPDRVAARAVDGVTGGRFADGFTFTSEEQQPWWQVDLGADRQIGRVAIWGRTDCCVGEFRDLRVFVSREPFAPGDTPAALAQRPGVWSTLISQLATPLTTVDVSDSLGRPVAGRYVRIQRTDFGRLILAEVQVFDRANKAGRGQVGPHALELDGLDDTVVAPGGPGLDLRDGAAAAWVRPDWQPGVPAEAPAVLALSDGTTSRYSLHIAPDLSGVVVRGGGAERRFPATFSPGAWRHVALVASGGRVTVYVDGQPAGPAQDLDLSGASGLPLHIGSLGGTRAFFRGGIDEVQVYARPLQQLEVAALVASGWQAASLASSGAGVTDAGWTFGVPQGLEGFYRLDLRGVDAAGFEDPLGGAARVWNGPIDTLAPRASLVRVPIGNPANPEAYRYTLTVQDFNLSETGFASPCPAAALRRSEYVTPEYLGLTGLIGGRLFQISATCDLPAATPPGELRARDLAGNQVVVEAVTDPTAPLQPVVITAPTEGGVLTSLAPTSVIVTAAAGVTVQRLFVDGALVTGSWTSSGTGSTITWQASWTPDRQGRRVLTIEYTRPGSSEVERIESFVFVDTEAPIVSLATTGLALADLGPDNRLTLAGGLTDLGGVARVEVTLNGGGERVVVPGEVVGDRWSAAWFPNQGVVRDGVDYSVTVRVVDVAGREATASGTVRVDLATPAPFDVSVTSGGQPVAAGDTLRGPSPSLQLNWGGTSDGGGLARLVAGWSVEGRFEPTFETGLDTTSVAPGSITRAAGEDGVQITAIVRVTDAAGNEREETVGPFVIDAPLTPDFFAIDSGYQDWTVGPCAQIGVDRRVARAASDRDALRAEQRLFASWVSDSGVADIRLAWAGANWDTDGDLFVYLDTRPGGAIRAFNPYTTTDALATIFMPGVTPATIGGGGPDVFGADYLVWVRDSRSADLLQWNGSAWELRFVLDEGEFRFNPEVAGGLTDLSLISESIDFDAPQTTPLGIVAFATDEGALRPWATMPPDNPANSARLDPLAGGGAGASFALSRAYHWPNLPSVACPNGSLPPGGPAFPDADIEVTLVPSVAGSVYRYNGDGLAELWGPLFAAQPDPARNTRFGFLDPRNRPLAGDGAVQYSVRLHNRGGQAIDGLRLEVHAWNGLSLDGGNQQTITVGTLAPGASVERTITGRAASAGASNPAWANLEVRVADGSRATGEPPLEFVWADHPLDTAAPSAVGAWAADYLVSPGRNLLRGFAFDAAGIAEVRLLAGPQGGAAQTFSCPDATPDDGQWACVWSATEANGGTPPGDGIRFELRLVAVDGNGLAGPPSPPVIVEVRSSAPEFTLDLPEAPIVPAAEGSTPQVMPQATVALQAGATLSGTIADIRAGTVEVCVGGTCEPATVAAVPRPLLSVVDQPVADVGLDAAPCGSGVVARTFVVGEDLPIAAVHFALTTRGDVRASLRAPSGVSARLIAFGSAAGYNVLLADDAPAEQADNLDAATVVVGALRPADPLAALAGGSAAGTWTLEVCGVGSGGAYIGGRLELLPADSAPRPGVWFYELPQPDNGLDGSMLQVTVRGVGLGGAAREEIVTVTVDTVAPRLVVEQIASALPLGANLTPVLRGSVADGGGVAELFVDVVTPDGEVRRERIEPAAAWSFELAPDAAGIYQLTVSAADSAGNLAVSDAYTLLVREPASVALPLIFTNAQEIAGVLEPQVQLPWVTR
jgi:hypothetical protein